MRGCESSLAEPSPHCARAYTNPKRKRGPPLNWPRLRFGSVWGALFDGFGGTCAMRSRSRRKSDKGQSKFSTPLSRFGPASISAVSRDLLAESKPSPRRAICNVLSVSHLWRRGKSSVAADASARRWCRFLPRSRRRVLRGGFLLVASQKSGLVGFHRLLAT